MQLSIIVPVYNMAAGGKLSFCLDSLLQQTICDYEIIAVDDKSTDDSLQILREYEARFPERMKVIASPENRRQGGARNLGLKAAEGEWIGFVDSDDWVSPDCYEKLLQRAEETGADVVGCDYSLVTEQTFIPGKTVQNNTAEQTGVLDEAKHRLLLMRSGSMVIKIYRRKVLTENKLEFPEGIFMRIIVPDRSGACILSISSVWKSHCIFIISMMSPRCIILRKPSAEIG